ncbi:hypothetical protein [Rhodoferax sp.]|uniref:hypothetical protein n=1 Tax=Rhodoferax sp. TaxID=50421 RepID=UPI002635022D|nr:hypothetical protein [Rhodoferax sp.]MDD2926497.1 hypothetical protein [Rhodoferax sp.]
MSTFDQSRRFHLEFQGIKSQAIGPIRFSLCRFVPWHDGDLDEQCRNALNGVADTHVFAPISFTRHGLDDFDSGTAAGKACIGT